MIKFDINADYLLSPREEKATGKAVGYIEKMEITPDGRLLGTLRITERKAEQVLRKRMRLSPLPEKKQSREEERSERL